MSERNIIWVDADREPPHTVAIGMDPVIVLDVSASEARKGFYHPLAGTLIQHDDGWKAFREDKGAKG